MRKTDAQASPLDDALRAWCDELHEVINEAAGDRNLERRCRDPWVDVALNAHADQIDASHLGEFGVKLSGEGMRGPAFRAFDAEVRGAMPAVGWPLRLRLTLLGFADRIWWRPRPTGMGVCGKLFGSFGERSNDMVVMTSRWSGNGEVAGLDRLVEGMRLVDLACPPSNRPIGAWSTSSDLIGSTHVHIEDIHARTEAEFILKQSLFRRGLAGFREMIAAGRFEPMRNDERCWFVVTELGDLDRNPLGVNRRFLDAVDEINDRLTWSQTAELEP